MDIFLKETERIDNLEYKGLKIIQDKTGFCFGIDSILLSDFAKRIPAHSKVLDLGTGTGILGLLLCKKTNLDKIFGIEIQEDVAQMARKSITLNNLHDKFEIINCNIKDLNNYFELESFDCIVSNPPYMKLNSGLKNENKTKLVSRHEISASLEDFIDISFKMLKDNRPLYLVHRTERLVDLIYLLRKYKLEPKLLRFVYSDKNSAPKLVLIKSIKNAKPFLKVDKPLIIYDSNGNYTNEILKIYNKI